MLKKLTAVLLSAFIVVLSVPAVRSGATDVTVANTFADICYGYTSNDFLSTPNYDNYFMQNDTSNSDLAIKYSVYKDIFCNNSNANFGSTMWTLLKDDIDNNMSNIGNTYFADKDGLRFSYFRYNPSTYGIAYFNCVAVGSDDLAIVQNTIISKSSFTVYDVKYNDQGGAFNGSFQFVSENTNGINAKLENGLYKYVLMPESSNIRILYSEMPLYLTYTYNSEYSDLSYLASSPYNYNNVENVYNCIDNDKTGFVIDRRTEKMKNEEEQENNIINDADLMDFKGELGFESFVFKGYIDKNADLVFPSYVVNYKYNNYTDLRKDNVLLYVDYSFDFKLTYNMAGGTVGYQSVDMQNMSVQDITDNRTAFGGDLNGLISQSKFINVRETSGLHLQSNDIVGYEDISQFQSTSLIANLGRYFYKIMNNSNANHVVNSKRDSYFYIYIDFYLVDNTDGIYQESKHIKRRIDYWGDSTDPTNHFNKPAVNDVDNSGIIDDDKAFQDFIDSYNSNNTSEDSGYINYLPSVNNGGSNSSIGNITINQNPYPYLLVDIPEGEWMSKTPNLTTILTDFKDALSEVKNNSILNVMSETYNYLPVPVWQYFTYGVGILIAIGIWRAITRR